MRPLNSSTSPNGQKPDSRHRRGVCVCVSALVPTPVIVHTAAEGPQWVYCSGSSDHQ